jgi:hypothetical protein
VLSSTRAIMTGLYRHHTSVDHDNAVLARPTIIKTLHDQGYRMMLAFGAVRSIVH